MIKSSNHEASNGIFENAKRLRKNMTRAEKCLWKILRDRRFDDHKFRRQHPIGTYIVDFYCIKSQLVIEVDGEIHYVNDNPSYDAERTLYLESLGIKVIRFTNKEVLGKLDKVLDKISLNLRHLK